MNSPTQTLNTIATVGEEVGYQIGQKFVLDYQSTFQDEIPCFLIGRNIIDRILAQPGCVGIKFYKALNEFGQQTLVYIGTNYKGQNIFEVTSVDSRGVLEKKKGIVADRSVFPKPQRGDSNGIMTPDDFEWTID